MTRIIEHSPLVDSIPLAAVITPANHPDLPPLEESLEFLLTLRANRMTKRKPIYFEYKMGISRGHCTCGTEESI